MSATVGSRNLTRKERQLLKQLPVGDRIRYARLSAGLTQEQLADEVGTERVAVIHWEKNRHRPLRDYREAIAEATGFPVEFFRHDGRGGD